MTRIAIIGGGISGLTAAYELELARRAGAPIDWHLYEASGRLGGIIETTRHTTPEGDFILEGGPDAWVTEKPWARDLAIELGLEDQLITSNDTTRRTYILLDGKLQPIPDHMRLMVPEDLSALEDSPLFTDSARAAYAAELANAAELQHAAQLREAAPEPDESVAIFVLRHFGAEVLTRLAAPLLSGVFGGDVAKLSARAVMPHFVAMERNHGSLIAALQSKSRERGNKPPQPIFTSLRNGMASLIDALISQLPVDRLHIDSPATLVSDEYGDFEVCYGKWRFGFSRGTIATCVLFGTPLDTTRHLLGQTLGKDPVALLPADASSAVLATLCWNAEIARTFAIPTGFGFLVPQSSNVENCHPERSEGPASPQMLTASNPQLLACTFVDQKFPYRAPPGARILRAFFGGPAAETLSTQSDATIAAAALTQLRAILGPIPNPTYSTIRRWPRSLPQYEVGHLARIAQLDSLIAQTPGLHLLGNSYQGVGLPDLIHAARTSARSLIPNP